jgi:hypothetical protein
MRLLVPTSISPHATMLPSLAVYTPYPRPRSQVYMDEVPGSSRHEFRTRRMNA